VVEKCGSTKLIVQEVLRKGRRGARISLCLMGKAGRKLQR